MLKAEAAISCRAIRLFNCTRLRYLVGRMKPASCVRDRAYLPPPILSVVYELRVAAAPSYLLPDVGRPDGR